MSMKTSSRPYLIRALYEWILDNRGTPHLLVNAEASDVIVPRAFVEEGKIVFDISPDAVKDLLLNNELVEFRGRFGNAITYVSFPTENVLAIYNEEGVGMFFEEIDSDENSECMLTEEEHDHSSTSTSTSSEKKKKQSSRSHLKIVK